MSKKFKVKVNDKFEFEFTDGEIQNLDESPISATKTHVLENHKSILTKVLKADFLKKEYEVEVNSNGYEVKISDELDILINEMGLSLGSAQVENDVKAPMPGLILDINVNEGDEVKEGDYLLVLEAMKMENALTAPMDGIVKKISINKGDKVDKNQLLVEME